jgi:hypothetical protein
MGFQADVRAAAMTTLGAHASAASVKLQTYAGRPRSIHPPTAFIDVVRETIVYLGHLMQRTVQADVVLVHGSFDSADAAAQKDAFVDGYIDYVRGNVHAAGANTTLGVVSTEDDPTFVPDWLPQADQRVYYATRITLEGFAGD